MMTRPPSPNEGTALRIFAPIAANYDRWSAWLSMGQDPRWRREMVARLDVPSGGRVLDVAAGTGMIGRLLRDRGHEVVSVDVSAEMLRVAHERGASAVLGTAEALPFPRGTFDALTFGYLLRYIPEPLETMRELVRVLRPGGVIGMVEFSRPRQFWRPWWWLYTRWALPAAGTVAGPGWRQVGAFLGPSIDAFVERFDDERLVQLWEAAGLVDVRLVRRSLGGGMVMWGRRP